MGWDASVAWKTAGMQTKDSLTICVAEGKSLEHAEPLLHVFHGVALLAHAPLAIIHRVQLHPKPGCTRGAPQVPPAVPAGTPGAGHAQRQSKVPCGHKQSAHETRSEAPSAQVCRNSRRAILSRLLRSMPSC